MKKVMFADSHAHLLSEMLFGRVDEIVSNMSTDGLDFIVEVGTDFQDSRVSLELANKYERVYCTLGVHPHYAGSYCDEFEKWAASVIRNPKIVAIGECGLDFHYMYSAKPIQIETFIRHIKLADKLGIPLVVHSRDAFDETYRILSENKELLSYGVLMHCYSYGAEEVRKLLELGCYFSLSGAVTYGKSYESEDAAREAVMAIPLDRLLVETDAPYLTPVPFRGKINEPKNVRHTIEHIAKIWGKSFDEMAGITLENTKRFFKIN
ncbi:MAG: TatD family hydrolase [Firmicutes bacterium]|nr:TatD family hydrolase [Bacillota bacterium]